jgi:DNA-directed RNA polymerase specialized sigma24 family protein
MAVKEKKEPEISEKVLDKLAYAKFCLLLLDPSVFESRFLEIRRRLIVLFEGRIRGNHSLVADDLADETIDRAIKKIAKGEDIDNIWNYLCGIASNLLKEEWRKVEKDGGAVDDLPPNQEPFEDYEKQEQQDEQSREKERRFRCLDECSALLKSEDRELYLWHIRLDGHAKEERDAKAREMGITRNALNIRIARIRNFIEECCIDCYRGLLKK